MAIKLPRKEGHVLTRAPWVFIDHTQGHGEITLGSDLRRQWLHNDQGYGGNSLPLVNHFCALITWTGLSAAITGVDHSRSGRRTLSRPGRGPALRHQSFAWHRSSARQAFNHDACAHGSNKMSRNPRGGGERLPRGSLEGPALGREPG
jgi:hypothetical protein